LTKPNNLNVFGTIKDTRMPKLVMVCYAWWRWTLV